MNVRQISASGAVVLWTINTDFEKNRLLDKLDGIGLRKFAPNARTNESALYHSLADYTAGADVLIEPLQKRINGYEVRRVLRGTTENEYRPYLRAHVTEGCDVVIELRGSCDDDQNELAERIQQGFDRYKTHVTGAGVGKALVNILDYFGGLRLRDAGGAYGLAQDDLERWERVEQAVTAAAIDWDRVKFDMLRTVADERGFSAIKASLEDEVTREAGLLLNDITSGELGDQAITNRVAQANTLRQKIERYEGIIGELLPNLRAACDACQSAAAMGTLAVL